MPMTSFSRRRSKTLCRPAGATWWLLFATATLILGHLLAATPAAQAALPSANGKIAFHTDRDGNHEIYVVNADGSRQIRLTDGPSYQHDLTPTWSPDGTKIAFTREGGVTGLWLMNPDGSGKVQIVADPHAPDPRVSQADHLPSAPGPARATAARPRRPNLRGLASLPGRHDRPPDAASGAGTPPGRAPPRARSGARPAPHGRGRGPVREPARLLAGALDLRPSRRGRAHQCVSQRHRAGAPPGGPLAQRQLRDPEPRPRPLRRAPAHGRDTDQQQGRGLLDWLAEASPPPALACRRRPSSRPQPPDQLVIQSRSPHPGWPTTGGLNA